MHHGFGSVFVWVLKQIDGMWMGSKLLYAMILWWLDMLFCWLLTKFYMSRGDLLCYKHASIRKSHKKYEKQIVLTFLYWIRKWTSIAQSTNKHDQYFVVSYIGVQQQNNIWKNDWKNIKFGPYSKEEFPSLLVFN